MSGKLRVVTVNGGIASLVPLSPTPSGAKGREWAGGGTAPGSPQPGPWSLGLEPDSAWRGGGERQGEELPARSPASGGPCAHWEKYRD